MKSGIKSQLFKFSKLQCESLDVVRQRVLRIIRGKKLVGYHLPQKMADFGLYSQEFVQEQPVLKELSKNQSKAEDSPAASEPAVFNPISPKKEP